MNARNLLFYGAGRPGLSPPRGKTVESESRCEEMEMTGDSEGGIPGTKYVMVVRARVFPFSSHKTYFMCLCREGRHARIYFRARQFYKRTLALWVVDVSQKYF